MCMQHSFLTFTTVLSSCAVLYKIESMPLGFASRTPSRLLHGLHTEAIFVCLTNQICDNEFGATLASQGMEASQLAPLFAWVGVHTGREGKGRGAAELVGPTL